MNQIKITTIPTEIIKTINGNDNYITGISKRNNSGTSFITVIIKKFYKQELLEYNKIKGKEKHFGLTEKGEKIKRQLLIIEKICYH